ncbi:hypothetical protein N2152v2_010504 [Parachlorella kessleri]
MRTKRVFPSVAAAYLARWLASIAPGVVELKLQLFVTSSAPSQQLALQPFLASSKMVKTLDLNSVHLLPADLALVGLLTMLTTLRCECFLPGHTQPLSSLATLSRLRQLDLTILTTASGAQLPSSLSALTGLQALNLCCRASAIDWESPVPRLQLPQEWCQAATQVTSVRLDFVDLPGIGGRSRDSVMFPAMQDLELVSPSDPIGEALACCKALQALKVDSACFEMTSWAALSALPQLGRLIVLNCMMANVDEDEEFRPVPESLSALTSLTYLYLHASGILPAIPQLPALQHAELVRCEISSGAAAGWPLPEGPWLNNLVALRIEEAEVGSVEAALRQATRLSTLELEQCPYMKLTQEELPLLLRLPLKLLVLDKRPEYDYPEPLWDEESIRVAEELRKALALRECEVEFDIFTKDSLPMPC